ncbi:MAG: ATP-binding cassette domain-containing protein [Candidatus Latescibacteria bacterium]|nr:ATP-binding cassette domain-containing protein [Candidatus Latescibacterota bacterium]NIM22293.1 ATP-binding cassette domain-containing protein [Candidatus Latescibacterota bacterium]NIM65772.1 ATP-binding cassette domain-containing protein [Candidatus Latescibacterota bacterium]NIO02157.1 ATP-binding cassette domain-containing protein [Candidatus Latescibacterota bacterium]NIO28989.1 ATP-binding cassette domain-containing protein [Candidatus Latescibacterota bacterium]
MGKDNNSKIARAHATRTVFSYLRRYRKRLVIGGLCLVVTDMLLLINPWLLKLTIDALKTGITRNRLLFFALFFVVVTIVSGVFRFLMRRIMIGVSRRIEFDIRGDFFSHLETLNPYFYNRHHTGDLMALATNDLNAVRALVGPGVMYSLNTVVVGSLAIFLMLYLSVKLTIVSLLPMVLLTVAVYHSVKVIHGLFESVQKRFGELNSRAQENLSGIRVVKAYAREQSELNTFRITSLTYVQENMKLFKVQSLLHPLLATVAGLGALFILWLGGREVIDGRLTLGSFVAFNGYLAMMIWPMIALGWVMNVTQRGLASMERINAVMDEKPEIRDASPEQIKRLPPPRRGHTISFENVSFSYDHPSDRKLVLKNVSFTIGEGETVAIIGPTGSGKTTLVSLILRLIEPTEGRILVGGIPIQQVPIEDLRRIMGVVPQDIFLFSDTIRENMSFGAPELSEKELREISRGASIEDEVEAFPEKYDSWIGERGINLSGGQKQRVAIARALAKNPDILILDDALSSVDTDTEERILVSLRSLMKERTSILISHRISTVRIADRILVLDDGELVEAGTHDELVKKRGLYANIYRKQLIMSELEGG